MPRTPADPWAREVTLRKIGARTKATRHMVNLTEYKMPPWDVDSLRIKADLPEGLRGVEISCGGVPFISFTVDMLRKLTVVDGWMEVLVPYMPYLPTSRLLFHETYVVFSFEHGAELPKKVEVRLRRCWPPPVSIPLFQPVDVHQHVPVTVPTLFNVNGGMGCSNLWSDKPYGLPYSPPPPEERQDDGPAPVGGACAAAAAH